MKAGWQVAVALVLSTGCARADDDGQAAQTSETSSSSTSLESTTSTVETSASGETADPASDSSADGDASTSSSADGSSETSTSGGQPNANKCPAGAPASWVLCEDFDAVADPTTDLSQWNVLGNRFGIDPDETSGPGDQVLRMSLIPGEGTFGGWVTLRFGDGPDAPVVDSPDGRYDEIWLRYRLRTAGDWPGHTAGDIGEIASMNGENWGLAADLNLYVDEQFRMHPRAWTCIFGGEQACDGENDWAGTIEMLWSTATDHVLTGADTAGQWQCIEARMRLNGLGAGDGEAEVWVDGAEVFLQENIDWRGTWDEYGLNAIRFTNYANASGGQRDFFIDDVVAATERVGCDGVD